MNGTHPSKSRSVWSAVEPSVRLVAATVIIGAALGAVIGGVGGRLAMRILFLTSSETVKGVTSDDGFEIGRFTLGDTIGLIFITALIGVIAALLYLVAQPFVTRLPVSAPAVMGVFYGVVGGALIVNPDGVDFRLLEPPLLAIGLFVCICGSFGAAVAHLLGAAAARDAWPERRSWWLLAPALLVALIPFFFVPALFGLVLRQAATSTDVADRRWRAVRTAAFIVMAGIFVLGATNLWRDTTTLV